MKLCCLLFSFTIFFFLLPVSYADDANIMHKLSQTFSPRPPGWPASSAPCSWQGIRCDSSNRVISINLTSKSLTGELPADLLNQLTSLQSLSLQQNRISGTLPSLSNLNNLKEAYFDGNKFTSFPSNFLSNLPNLQTLSLDDNPLNPWTLQEETLSQLSSLEVFRASNTNTYGSLPDVFESMSGLQDLRLSYNNLTGPFPPSFARSSIRHLWINDQKAKFSGTLDQLGKMPSLVQAWLHNNAFSGPIPDLSKCTQLFDLQLRSNQLTGLVPPSMTKLPKLANISLQNNMLQGPMPRFKNGVKTSVLPGNRFCNPKPGSCDPQVMVLLEIVGAMGYPTQLAEAWKGNNACDGWVHVTCDPAQKVVIGINFAKEGFNGTISPKFANLTSLTSLVLSDNRLYGKIPSSLLNLTHLHRLDLSSNNLTGKVPSFSKSVVVNVNNNPFIGTDVDTTPGSKTSQKRSLSKWLLFLIVGVVSAVLIVGFSFLIYFVFGKRFFRKRFGNRRLKMGDDQMNLGVGSSMTSSKGPFDGGGATYSIELLREVTNHFSNKNILGKGGFGVVYKGELQDGTQIAVKRMESDSLGIKGLSEFEAEIAVLSKVRHMHLVALLGFCVNETERFLVYECMPEGTLGQHLFEWKELGCAPLAWKQRLVIAFYVARGVEYLHSLAQESFIHRDLKPSNILLGSDMRAKVSDFGLARNAPDGKYSVETRVAGTFGYLAPEYAATGRVTTKVDVFAYGVVLMEMITGRKALDRTLPEDQIQIVTWFRRAFVDKSNMRKSIDPSTELDDETYESVCKVAELASHCTAREPLQRLDMGHVVSALSPLVDQWKPIELENEESVCIDVEWAMKSWQTGKTSTTVNQCSRTDSSAE